MPIYDFKHNESGEIWTDEMKYVDKAAYMVEHNCTSIFLTTPHVIGTSKDIYSRSSDAFKDRLARVKKGYPKKGPNAANMSGW
jgi:hypothetical protein